jgi:hypothetical protein
MADDGDKKLKVVTGLLKTMHNIQSDSYVATIASNILGFKITTLYVTKTRQKLGYNKEIGCPLDSTIPRLDKNYESLTADWEKPD